MSATPTESRSDELGEPGESAAADEGAHAGASGLTTLGRIATDMAHELNNILGAVGGFAAILERHVPDEHAATRAYEELVRSCERGSSITRKVLDLGRPTTSPIASVDLSTLVRELEPLLRQLLPERILLASFVPADLPPVAARALDLELVILNLVVNARDAIDGLGSIEIRASLAHDEGSPASRRVLLTVRDSGHGMEPEVLSRAFDPFFTTKPAGSGTGLGLALAREALQSSDGSIGIASQPGAGTLVTIALQAPEQPLDMRTTVLLCMEPGATRALASSLMKRRGFDVIEVATLDEAGTAAASIGTRLAATFVEAAISAVGTAELSSSLGHPLLILESPVGPEEILDALDGLGLPTPSRKAGVH